MPPITAVGTNTASSTSVVAITGPVTSTIALAVASLAEALLVDQAHGVLDHHDRVVDDDADGQHQTEQRQRVDRQPEAIITAKVPISDTGIVMAGTSVVRKSCRKM